MACGGDDDPGDVAGVFPKDGFIGRKVTVEVTGDTTSWSAPTVNFGEGITPGAVTVISPQALQVELTIAPTAPAGARDVTVTDGSDVLTLTGAFTLKDPVMSVAAPNFEQGYPLHGPRSFAARGLMSPCVRDASRSISSPSSARAPAGS
jgi:hypothetical protein